MHLLIRLPIVQLTALVANVASIPVVLFFPLNCVREELPALSAIFDCATVVVRGSHIVKVEFLSDHWLVGSSTILMRVVVKWATSIDSLTIR